MVATVSEKREQWPRAFADYERTLELNPNHIKARAAPGKIYVMADDLDPSEKAAQLMLAEQPDGLAGRTVKAALLAQRGNATDALAEVEGVLKTARADQFIANQRTGPLFLARGKYDSAIEEFEQALQRSPSSADGLAGYASLSSRTSRRMRWPRCRT